MPSDLFDRLQFGNIQLKNRIVMAPMTRSQSDMTVPTDDMARHYSERAQAGLIITEGTSPSMHGITDSGMPGLFMDEHAQGWLKVTQKVHEKGGKIFVQLMHCGRASHPYYKPEGARVLAPSAVRLEKVIEITDDGETREDLYPVPEEMTVTEILQAIDEFAVAAQMAVNAGFDGVEIHAANGYLIDQFLNTASNSRTDRWGGNIQNRLRFAISVLDSVCEAVGPHRTGIRISPYAKFNGMSPDPEMQSLYLELINHLNKADTLYVHIVDRAAMGAEPIDQKIKTLIREKFNGHVILSGGYNRVTAQDDLRSHRADLIAFGRPFISNANLVDLLKDGGDIKPPDYDIY